MEGHDWPGNVRELRNVIERAIYRWADAEKPVDALSFDPFASPSQPVSRKAPPRPEASAPAPAPANEIGRAPCRERVCQYVELTVARVSLKKTTLCITLRNHIHSN